LPEGKKIEKRQTCQVEVSLTYQIILHYNSDLGVELPLQQVTNAQKEMVAACNTVGKPVIVATQMLESMAKNPRPTRAEVSDVTNAIYDGADCVMLSGESAKGKYPVESVKMMNEIILSAERFARDNDVICKIDRFEGPATKDASIARAAVSAAHTEHVKAILALTTHGSLPALLSAYRPQVPILTFCANGKVGRQLMIYRGVHPVLSSGTKGKMEEVVQSAKNMGFLRTGDDVVVVSVEESDEIGRNPTMKIVSVP
jgi:pyruvate kinase